MRSGKRCGSPALRGKPYCYHHTENHMEHVRDRIMQQRLARLSEKLDAMDTSQLLNFLQHSLTPLQKTLRRFPEAGYTLVYTLDRLGEITYLESTLRLFLQKNQQFAASLQARSSGLNNLPANVARINDLTRQ
jgi:hypothetical protein